MISLLLIIDNYDSFTYNLAQYFAELGAEVLVKRNDALTLNDIKAAQPEGIVLSPGPGRPEGAGITADVIRSFSGRIPLLGVCLGHQAIGSVFGGAVVRAEKVMHGKQSLIHHDGRGVFKGIPSPFTAIRYHSLVVDRGSLPECLEISAWTEDGEIMGVRHRLINVEGVQFHPESILTDHGYTLLRNFLEGCGQVNNFREVV
ncbi:MAG: aminodeoxychorismate/anthranilate synthase component II [Actinobacteria bacterium]|nr:aminodeoxychorismate/anthranilate synthase component II [Actinomycetota bacterium]